MKIIRKYRCSKCGCSFSKTTMSNFIVGTIPKCPICGRNELIIENISKKEKEK